MKNIVIFGASGGIGKAFTSLIAKNYPAAQIFAFSQNPVSFVENNILTEIIDYTSEDSIESALNVIRQYTSVIDLVFVANGILYDQNFMPEKSLNHLSREQFMKVFEINTIFPALVAKYFVPYLNKNNISIFAALSARVGSISDNLLGGWYSYRISKSALNMVIRNISIEIKRKNKNAIIVGLHPGTVDTNLSKPFLKTIEPSKLFTPEYSSKCLLHVIENLQIENSGKCFAWDGKEILP